jgi:hypothetical protein
MSTSATVNVLNIRQLVRGKVMAFRLMFKRALHLKL